MNISECLLQRDRLGTYAYESLSFILDHNFLPDSPSVVTGTSYKLQPSVGYFSPLGFCDLSVRPSQFLVFQCYIPTEIALEVAF